MSGKVIVYVRGGIVQDIKTENAEVVVVDYDVDEQDFSDKDVDGESCLLAFYPSEDDLNADEWKHFMEECK